MTASPISGHQQARWLGDWLRSHDGPFDRVLMGSLRRHRETAEGMGDMGAEAEVDDRLNELDYFNLAKAHSKATGKPAPTPDSFRCRISPTSCRRWHRAEIPGRGKLRQFRGTRGRRC